MPDAWSEFRDAEQPATQGDEWAEFQDAPRARRSKKTGGAWGSPTPKRNDPKPTAAPVPMRAIDGDTLSQPNNSRIRVFGMDAPERKQQGWNRQGRPVPIGQTSLSSIALALANRDARMGPVQGQSYGRTVAPVTIGDQDLASSMIRNGNAMAAPGFLGRDPQRRFGYMQDERLARQNGLGIHDTYFQSPEEYRRDPQPIVPRETVARFFDTPSPLDGMRPEDEQEYLRLLNDFSVSPEKVAEWTHARGWKIDPAELVKSRKVAKDTGKPIGFNYQNAPQTLTDLGDGATGAAIRGFGNGVVPQLLDELGAVPDSLGLTAGRENVFNSDRRWADIWSNNQRQNSSILGYDAYAHPYATFGGELAGGLVLPFGARAKTATDLAKVGGAYGFVGGFGAGEGSVTDRLPSAFIGGGLGIGGGVAIGKGIQALEPYVGRIVNHFTGKGSAGAPEGISGAMDDIPPPPPGFTPDAPLGGDPRYIDRISIYGPNAPLRPEPQVPISTRYPGPVAEGVGNTDGIAKLASQRLRDRDWIDIADVPPPPPGFRIVRPAMAMDAEPMASLSAAARKPDYIDVRGSQRPQPIDQPLTNAQRLAIAQRITPEDFLPIPANVIADVDEAAARDAGRMIPARPVNERGELERQTVRAWNGAEVPKVGPIDMVGWLRLNGGLADQGGELSHMGMTNAARRGMDFIGQEQRFGPLVNQQGMTLDDAAQRAWEAGYFPDHAERPSVNEFLDTLRDTYEGRNRAFLPDDMPQIDRFNAARADRFDLEQRLGDGPVWQDRSMPADEPQPLPPVQAYEEWPQGGPNFAGNINLGKLESPQDISRALAQTERRVGFDAATRGRVTQAETEQLASELGMTADDLLSRRQGQALNAEEALAARQILAKSSNELVNAARKVRSMEVPGDDALADFRQKWMRHVAIQEQVTGATAEAGRALSQFRMTADSRAVPGEVLASLVRGGGGRDNLRNVAGSLLKAVEKSPGKFNTDARELTKPTWRNKATEYYINALLSGPQTHVVNMVSNTLTAMAQIPEFATAAAIGGVRQIASRDPIDRIVGSEVGARTFGLLQGAKDGAKMFVQALKTGEPSDFAAKVEGEDMKAIPGKLGEIVRTPTRFLTAEDELFKGVARRMEMQGQAVRITRREGLKGEAAKRRIAQLVADPTDEMVNQALDYGRYLTFQSPLGDFASKVSAMTNVPSYLGMGAKVFLPFVRTPTNLLKFATERSPAAPLLKEWKADWQAGGARRDLAIARMMLGTGLGMAVYEAAADGKITGSAPTDKKKSRLLYADGWQPYSVKIGDTYYSYKRLDPLSTTIGVAADMATLPEGMSERQREDKATLLIASIMGNLASKTWLSGLSTLVAAADEPDRYADNLVQRLVGSFLIPGMFAQTARTMDPTARQADTTGEALRSRTPGLSDDLLPRRDVWGRPITSEGGVGPDFVSPIWTSTALRDPVNHELLQTEYSPGYPSKKVKGRELTPEEYDRYQEMAGGLSHERLTELVTSPNWRKLDVEMRAKLAKRTVDKVREEVRATLFGGGSKGASVSTVPSVPGGAGRDQWSEFDDAEPRIRSSAPARDEWSEFADPDQPDVVGDLTRAIPGIRFTSGYRSPEYNQSLRARGYNAARNSTHLDGSGLDMLPPPGKSMQWLRNEVGRLYPDARLLIHDGHLHASIPGYYAAPVFGGARAAGVQNPNHLPAKR